MGDAVEILGLRHDLPREPVGQIFSHEGHPAIAVVDLGLDVSDALRRSWDARHPLRSGGVIESVWLQPLFGAGSAARRLPARWQRLRGDSQSRDADDHRRRCRVCRDGTGRHRRASTVRCCQWRLVAVVAPVILFMAVSSMITGARLDRMQEALGALSEILERMHNLMEANAYATFQSATKRLDGIQMQFQHSRRFTDGMKSELVQAQGDLNRLHYQYGHLANREIRSENDAKAAVSDIDLFVLSSLMDIRADVLRLYLTLQDDPGFAGRRQEELRGRVERCNKTFKELLDKDPIEGFHKALQQELSEVKFYDLPSHLRARFGGGLPARIRTVEAIRETFKPIRERIERWTSGFESADGELLEQSILVYRDLDGERVCTHITHGIFGCSRWLVVARNARHAPPRDADALGPDRYASVTTVSQGRVGW